MLETPPFRRLLVAVLLVALSAPTWAGAASAGAPGVDDETPRSPGAIATPSDPVTPSTPEEETARVSPRESAPLDPAARLLDGGDASEYWTLYVELASGHRITQRFLLTNAGPGEHTAVAIGHLAEPGRAPYRYENGRMRPRWTLSDDRLYFDIAASHLDLHRPRGELRISKEDVQIQLFFDLSAAAPAARVPEAGLPDGYRVDVLALAAPTRGSVRGPWMPGPVETTGRTWLVHTWTTASESEVVRRRLELFGRSDETAFYGIGIDRGNGFDRAWQIAWEREGSIIESTINIPARWSEQRMPQRREQSRDYPLPGDLKLVGPPESGQITLGREWLRYDPLSVIPQPFRWFIRRTSQPLEVWAEADIEVTLSAASEPNSLPSSDAHVRDVPSNSERESEDEVAKRRIEGVASVTFLNPLDGR